MDQPGTADRARPPLVIVGLALAGAALMWSWWPSLRGMIARWSGDPRYSHGFLVPAFAAYLLWARRAILAGARPAPTAWGLVPVALGMLLAAAGARYYLGWVEAAAPLVALAGLSLLARGRAGLRWAWPSIGFLVFMIPLPYRVESALGYPLQRLATMASTYALQTLGLPAVSEGNIILIDEARIGVVEACNGLGMLLMFVAFAVAVVAVTRAGLADRVAILLSAAPIALFANVSRITLTGLLHRLAGDKAADHFYHDLAGWLMMPIALAAFGLELFLLSRLFVEVPARDRAAGSGVPGLVAAPPAGEVVVAGAKYPASSTRRGGRS